MKIGIISDTHDELHTLAAALEILRQGGVKRVLHCGDVCGPQIIGALAEFETWIAHGNMDRNGVLMHTVEETLGRGRLAWLQRPPLNGYAAAMLHGDNEEMLRNLIAAGDYAYVFHGHTHRRRDQIVGRTRVINPGALGGTRRQSRSFCILDLESGENHFIELPDG